MLTTKQHDLLLYIADYQKQHGISPSFDEMRDSLNLKSKSGIHRLLAALEERGFLRKLPNRARALEVLRTPYQGKMTTPLMNTQSGTVSCMGKIAAGTPIEAIADESNTIEVPQYMIRNGTFYALEVEGDSMMNAGIMDGDVIIVQKTSYADKGAIVVALIDREEATLKYFYPEDGMITLKAANPNYMEQHYKPEQVEIQGKLHALLRQYDG